MANVLTRRAIYDSTKRAIILTVGRWVDTGDAEVIVVDASALSTGQTVTNLAIEKIEYSIHPGVAVHLEWDATTDVEFLELHGSGCFDFTKQPLTNDSGTGITGDILATTYGLSAAGEGYTILFHLIKQP